jgi:hypothetical protein
VSGDVNPYQSPSFVMNGPVPVTDKGEFLIEGLTIVGGDEIWLPPICVVSGSHEELQLRVTKLKYQPLWLWCLYSLATLPLLGVICWLVFSQKYLLTSYRPGLFEVVIVLLSIAMLVGVDLSNAQILRTTKLHWYCAKKELQAVRYFVLLLAVLFVGLIFMSIFIRGTIGFIPFAAVFVGIYARKRFVRPKLVERHTGFSRIIGLKPAFFKAISETGG